MLSTQQIQAIEKAIHANGVPYYDVAIELTDHLVEEIETEMEQTQLGFDALLQQKILTWKQEWKSIVAAKKQQLQKQYQQQFKQEFMSYFTFPRVMFTVSLVLITGLILQYNNNQRFANAAIHILNLICVSYAFGKGSIIGKNQQQKKQKLLALACLQSITWYTLVFQLMYLFLTLLNLFYDNRPPLPTAVFTMAVAIFPVAVLVALAWRKVNISANEIVRAKYQQAFYA